jgi:hypothetical protein
VCLSVCVCVCGGNIPPAGMNLVFIGGQGREFMYTESLTAGIYNTFATCDGMFTVCITSDMRCE